MTEERYVAEFTPKGAYIGIKDTLTNELIMTLESIELLNQQDTQIKEFEGIKEALGKDLEESHKIIKKQSVRIYCQDQEIQRLNEQLEKIPPKIKEVWIDD